MIWKKYKWRHRDGMGLTEFEIPLPVDGDEPRIDAEARAQGWPGHRGRTIDYLRDDARKLLARLRTIFR